MDQRWRQLADILVNYSTIVRPGERVLIAMTEVETYPLVVAVYEAVIRAGGLPQVLFQSERARHALLRYGSDEQLAWVPEMESYGMEWADVYLGLRGASNLHEHADIQKQRLAANQAAQGQISALRWAKTRWCLVRVPTEALAFQAGTNLETLEEAFFRASLLDWKVEAAQLARTAARLAGSSKVRIVGVGTDLQFSVAGRTWVALAGKLNMPDGEIMTAPIDETVNGHILFDEAAVFGGRLIEGLRLAWRDGQLTDASAATNQAYLEAVLATDAGANRIGEFAFGMNRQVTRFTRDVLLDEKIYGTVHIALGRAYPECGGTTVSAIHWDIVKDLRGEGAVYIDDLPVLEHGELSL
jgi:aminopeptidase